jgi:hypothetical protein
MGLQCSGVQLSDVSKAHRPPNSRKARLLPSTSRSRTSQTRLIVALSKIVLSCHRFWTILRCMLIGRTVNSLSTIYDPLVLGVMAQFARSSTPRPGCTSDVQSGIVANSFRVATIGFLPICSNIFLSSWSRYNITCQVAATNYFLFEVLESKAKLLTRSWSTSDVRLATPFARVVQASDAISRLTIYLRGHRGPQIILRHGGETSSLGLQQIPCVTLLNRLVGWSPQKACGLNPSQEKGILRYVRIQGARSSGMDMHLSTPAYYVMSSMSLTISFRTA